MLKTVPLLSAFSPSSFAFVNFVFTLITESNIFCEDDELLLLLEPHATKDVVARDNINTVDIIPFNLFFS